MPDRLLSKEIGDWPIASNSRLCAPRVLRRRRLGRLHWRQASGNLPRALVNRPWPPRVAKWQCQTCDATVARLILRVQLPCLVRAEAALTSQQRVWRGIPQALVDAEPEATRRQCPCPARRNWSSIIGGIPQPLACLLTAHAHGCTDKANSNGTWWWPKG